MKCSSAHFTSCSLLTIRLLPKRCGYFLQQQTIFCESVHTPVLQKSTHLPQGDVVQKVPSNTLDDTALQQTSVQNRLTNDYEVHSSNVWGFPLQIKHLWLQSEGWGRGMVEEGDRFTVIVLFRLVKYSGVQQRKGFELVLLFPSRHKTLKRCSPTLMHLTFPHTLSRPFILSLVKCKQLKKLRKRVLHVHVDLFEIRIIVEHFVV